MNTAPTNTGRMHCQCCGRAILAKTGRIAHHGYERPDSGWQTASCFGAKHLPWEVSRNAVELLIAHLARKLDSMIKQRGEVASEQGAQPVIHFYKVRNNQTRKSEARYVYLTRETFDAAKAEDKARRPIDRCLDGFYGEAATFDGFKARDLAKRDREIERVKADIVELTARFNSWTQTHRWNRTSKTWEVL